MINASWGGGGYSQALRDSIDRAGQSGVVFVAAAGNSGLNADSYPMYPAAYGLDNIVSVAASTRNEALAYFSNYGKTSVDLAAPGYAILSTVPNNGYATYSGTSMAAPHVAGAVALYLGETPAATPTAVRGKLIATADQRLAYSGRMASGGRLNLAKLLGIAVKEPGERPPSSEKPPTQRPAQPASPRPPAQPGRKRDRFRPVSPRSGSILRVKRGRTKKSVRFRWRRAKGAVRYRVYVNGERLRLLTKRRSRKSKRVRTRTTIHLAPGTYTWQVRAVDRRGRSRLARWTGSSQRRATFHVLPPRRH